MNDDRIRRAFNELREQAAGADPEVSLMSVTQPVPTRHWSLAVAAAAAIIVVIGAMALFMARTDRSDVVDPVPPPAIDTTTTIPSPTTATSDSTTTSTLPAAPPETTPPSPTVAASGWHVAGVASDDVLNVREGPGVEFPIVGALPHDAVDVEVLDLATSNLDGDDRWVGVRLPDGTTGWANQRFLAEPPSWLAGVSELPCGADQPGTSSAGGGTTGSATQILGVTELQGADCTRYVVVFGEGGEALTEAGSLAGEVSVTGGTPRVTVEMPSSITQVSQHAVDRRFGETIALSVVPLGSLDGLEVRFLHSSSRVAGVTILDNPARVVVDVAPAPTGTGLDVRPLVGGPVILESRVDPSVDRLGVGNAVTVRGYARFFEASGTAEVTTGGVPPLDIEWSGPSLTGSTANVGFLTAPWFPTWGEFEFTVDLTAGSYELYVSSCAADPTEQAVCGVRDTFDVAP